LGPDGLGFREEQQKSQVHFWPLAFEPGDVAAAAAAVAAAMQCPSRLSRQPAGLQWLTASALLLLLLLLLCSCFLFY
jgi:hypothetical protein